MASLRPVSYILNTSVTRSNSLADNLGAVCGTWFWSFSLALALELVVVVEVGTVVAPGAPGAGVVPAAGAVEVVVAIVPLPHALVVLVDRPPLIEWE